MKSLFMESSAVISDCGLYRYVLTRTWDACLPRISFVMLNPSTADANQDDPTIRRCMGFARDWGCGGIQVFNLFALRATNPNELHDVDDPVGPHNDLFIREHIDQRIVAAWGVMGTYRDRERHVLELLRRMPVTVECLGVTKHGRPKHPLYVPAATKLERFGL